MDFIEILKWSASISGMIGALSIRWISAALLTGDGAFWTHNQMLFGISIFGVYRNLIRKRKPRDTY